MKPRHWLSWIAACCLLSLPLPAIRSSNHEYGTPGIACLALVPIVCLFPAWWANPTLFVGCGFLARGDYRKARILGVVASALALSFFPMAGIDGAGPASPFWAACPVLLAVAGHTLAGKTGRFKPVGPEDWPAD